MSTRRHSDHPKWGCCGGYHQSFEEMSVTPEGLDLRGLTDEELRALVVDQDELPSHDLCREELLCLLTRRHARDEVPGKAILL